MAKKKFKFDPETLSYVQIEHTFTHKLKKVLVHLLSGSFTGAIFFLIFVSFVESPEEKQLSKQQEQMESQYRIIERQMEEIQEVLNDLQERDNNLYRVLFLAEPIPLEVRRAQTSNMEQYEQLLKKTNSKIVSESTQKLDLIKREIYIQSHSYDELIKLAKQKEEVIENMPAIQPVSNKDLKRVASGFGWRIDPVYHVPRFHAGMDFTAPEGTDIYATGNGTVANAGWESGYGNCIRIDHGYGFVTLYGHLSQINVNVGQKVKRGEVIGLVGSTGKSTGPHLHYEVHYKGERKNPQNYYFMDLTPEEYDRLIQISNNAGQMFD